MPRALSTTHPSSSSSLSELESDDDDDDDDDNGGDDAAPAASKEPAGEPANGKKGGKEPKKNKTQLRKERKIAQKKMDEEAALTCSVCGEAFSSRNKLFTHIKKTKHAALKYN